MATAHASSWVFDTDASVSRTLRRMRDKVRSCIASDPFTVQTANDVIRAVRPRDRAGQIDAITDWLDHAFRYVNDPVGVELLRDPATQFRQIRRDGFTQGDCDEAAMLSAALGMANGIPARFRALAFYRPDAPYTHVVADLQGPDGLWYPIDITKPPGMEHPPTPTRTLTLVV